MTRANDIRSIGVAGPADRGEFNEIVYRIVRSIPPGRVMAYGQIARLIPTPASIDPLAYRRIRARWVGYALASCPDDVPWHRVVNQKGEASPQAGGKHDLQIALLRDEAPPMKDQRQVDMSQAAWQPSAEQVASLINREGIG